MQLAIDIGNSVLKFALYDGTAIQHRGASIGELETALSHSADNVTHCMIASVTDHQPVAILLKKHNVNFSLLSFHTHLPIANLYGSPDTLGMDRITLAVAGHHLSEGTPVLVIGAGTCITYDFVDGGGYHGGAISTGITMRFRALQHFTSRLPLIDWSEYRDSTFNILTGTDSQQSILTGVLRGVIHEIDGTIDDYKRRYSGLRVMVTGGDMAFLVKNLKNDIFARPDMVLEGLNYIILHDA